MTDIQPIWSLAILAIMVAIAAAIAVAMVYLGMRTRRTSPAMKRGGSRRRAPRRFPPP